MVFKDKAATKIVVTLTDDDGGVAVTLSSTDKALLQSLKKGLQVDTDSGVLSFSSASACKLSL
jgi:hypothetical protein